MGDENGSPSPEVRSLRERVETLERRQNRLLQAVVEMHQRNERLRELLDTETEEALVDAGEYPNLAAILREETGTDAVASSLGIGDADRSNAESEESGADAGTDSGENHRRI